MSEREAPHWVLIADAMDYDDFDQVLGVFDSLSEAQDGLHDYLTEIIARHPSNVAHLGYVHSATAWSGRVEIESWTKDGNGPWTLDPVRGSLRDTQTRHAADAIVARGTENR